MDRAYVINFDECKSIKIHWVALHVDGDNITYFNSLRVENISKEIKKFIGNKTVTQNTNIQFNNVWIFLYLILC